MVAFQFALVCTEKRQEDAADESRARALQSLALKRHVDGVASHAADLATSYLPGAAIITAPECVHATVSGRFLVAFSGSIENYAYLVKKYCLEEAGLDPRGAYLLEAVRALSTLNDAEVVAVLFKRLGPTFMAKLKGAFAFALYDAHARRALAVCGASSPAPLWQVALDGSDGEVVAIGGGPPPAACGIAVPAGCEVLEIGRGRYKYGCHAPPLVFIASDDDVQQRCCAARSAALEALLSASQPVAIGPVSSGGARGTPVDAARSVPGAPHGSHHSGGLSRRSTSAASNGSGSGFGRRRSSGGYEGGGTADGPPPHAVPPRCLAKQGSYVPPHRRSEASETGRLSASFGGRAASLSESLPATSAGSARVQPAGDAAVSPADTSRRWRRSITDASLRVASSGGSRRASTSSHGGAGGDPCAQWTSRSGAGMPLPRIPSESVFAGFAGGPAELNEAAPIVAAAAEPPAAAPPPRLQPSAGTQQHHIAAQSLLYAPATVPTLRARGAAASVARSQPIPITTPSRGSRDSSSSWRRHEPQPVGAAALAADATASPPASAGATAATAAAAGFIVAPPGDDAAASNSSLESLLSSQNSALNAVAIAARCERIPVSNSLVFACSETTSDAPCGGLDASSVATGALSDAPHGSSGPGARASPTFRSLVPLGALRQGGMDERNATSQTQPSFLAPSPGSLALDAAGSGAAVGPRVGAVRRTESGHSGHKGSSSSGSSRAPARSELTVAVERAAEGQAGRGGEAGGAPELPGAARPHTYRPNSDDDPAGSDTTEPSAHGGLGTEQRSAERAPPGLAAAARRLQPAAARQEAPQRTGAAGAGALAALLHSRCGVGRDVAHDASVGTGTAAARVSAGPGEARLEAQGGGAGQSGGGGERSGRGARAGRQCEGPGPGPALGTSRAVGDAEVAAAPPRLQPLPPNLLDELCGGGGAATRERAVLTRLLMASPSPLTVVDVSRPGHPVVFANGAFLAETGYAASAVLGRNCRFLQAPPGALLRPSLAAAGIRRAICGGRSHMCRLLNFRADGAPLWNSLAVVPVRAASGRVTHYVGMQTFAPAPPAAATAAASAGLAEGAPLGIARVRSQQCLLTSASEGGRGGIDRASSHNVLSALDTGGSIHGHLEVA